MCGLAGIINKSGSAPSIDILRRMSDCIAHRGPDDDGQEVVGCVGLSHRRLSIVDVSPLGHQPMRGIDDRSWIVFNGEIYNFAAVRDALPPGPPYRGHSDTEVMLRALVQEGATATARFNGIFAFAFLDAQRNELVIARDQFGIKPLYFAEDGARFYFASEVKSILAAGFLPELNPLAAIDFAYSGWTDDDSTFLKGVRRVPPGSMLRYSLSTHTWRIEQYFTPRPDRARAAKVGGSYDAWKAEVSKQLERTVDAQLMSDVPVGTFCSGGIDSSLITALAARRHSGILAFNVTCPDAPEVDEGPFAKAVADHVGVKLHSLVLTRDAFRKALVHSVHVNEYPLAFVNTTPLFLLSKLAREQGVKVLLSGEGADETFGGYVFQYRPLAMQRVAMSLGPVGHTILSALRSLTDRLARRFSYSPPPDPANVGMHEILTGGLRRPLIQRESDAAFADAADPFDRVLSAELLRQMRTYMLPILHRTDRASMAASVEARVPFLDPDLVSLVMAMPARYKCGVQGLRPVGKAILKDIATQYLPRDIVYRPKMGFTVPAKYYTGPWPESWTSKGFVVSAFPIRPAELRDWIATAGDQTAAWMLTLEIWGQLFVQRRDPEHVAAEFLAADHPGGPR